MGIYLSNYTLGGEPYQGAYARMCAAGHDFRDPHNLTTLLIMRTYRSKDAYKAGKPHLEEIQVQVTDQDDLRACISGQLPAEYKAGPDSGTGLKYLAEFCLRNMPAWAGELD